MPAMLSLRSAAWPRSEAHTKQETVLADQRILRSWVWEKGDSTGQWNLLLSVVKMVYNSGTSQQSSHEPCAATELLKCGRNVTQPPVAEVPILDAKGLKGTTAAVGMSPGQVPFREGHMGGGPDRGSMKAECGSPGAGLQETPHTALHPLLKIFQMFLAI